MVYVGTYDCYENIKKNFSIKKISIKTMTLLSKQSVEKQV